MEEVDKIDFNGDPVAAETGQAEKTEDTKEEVETEVEETKEPEKEKIEDLPEWAQEKLKKTEADKENYKTGLLKLKKTLEPEKQEEETKEEIYPDWDETSKKFQEQTEKKAAKIAELKAQQIIKKTNEDAAIQQFISKHPELEDDNRWAEVVSNFHIKEGNISVDAYMKALDKSYFLTRYEKGEISNLEAEAFKKGEKKGKSEAQIADIATVSKTTSKTLGKEGSTVSDGALRLAQNMRVDPKMLAAEDDSLTAEIKL